MYPLNIFDLVLQASLPISSIINGFGSGRFGNFKRILFNMFKYTRAKNNLWENLLCTLFLFWKYDTFFKIYDNIFLILFTDKLEQHSLTKIYFCNENAIKFNKVLKVS